MGVSKRPSRHEPVTGRGESDEPEPRQALIALRGDFLTLVRFTHRSQKPSRTARTCVARVRQAAEVLGVELPGGAS
jgi:hypothetical protein